MKTIELAGRPGKYETKKTNRLRSVMRKPLNMPKNHTTAKDDAFIQGLKLVLANEKNSCVYIENCIIPKELITKCTNA